MGSDQPSSRTTPMGSHRRRTIILSRSGMPLLAHASPHSRGTVLWSTQSPSHTTRLASASDDKTVKIWGATTGSCIATIDVHRTFHNISFDNTGSYLNTDNGVIDLNAPSALNNTPATTIHHMPQFVGYCLSSDNSWISYNSKNLLWLPQEYRPNASAVEASTIVIGCPTGRVLVFKFSNNPPII